MAGWRRRYVLLFKCYLSLIISILACNNEIVTLYWQLAGQNKPKHVVHVILFLTGNKQNIKNIYIYQCFEIISLLGGGVWP